jgi:uncharacterized protein (DUF2164 family)
MSNQAISELTDDEKIAYIVEPLVEGIKDYARSLIETGELNADHFVAFSSRKMGEVLRSSEMSDWSLVHRRRAYDLVMDQLRNLRYEEGDFVQLLPKA